MYLHRPPRIKVLEALGAIADGRVKVLNGKAKVVSSEGDREYDVCVDLERRVAYSTDNGTHYRNYVGYPIIAVLMLKGVLPFDERLSQALKGIPWRKLNEEYKKYAKVMEIIFDELDRKGIRREEVERYIDEVMEKLRELKLRKGKC
ncbi:hypothetical protein IPA_01735 [Ignicoccus pacificus DSM 13166]|uniref:Uncharacterized protein n=1 Tax=Ignicoccus pacificus DSM 13166 TaxID=940294 RepID=A0A977PJ41_9CREN|nr:hypothetical protein IPA_01735 [Ignicoccus pacificus DSM 13166]